MLSRRPVGVAACTVNASFGHGSRQWCSAGAVSSTSQPVIAASGIFGAAAAERDAPPADPVAAVTTAAVSAKAAIHANGVRRRV